MRQDDDWLVKKLLVEECLMKGMSKDQIAARHFKDENGKELFPQHNMIQKYINIIEAEETLSFKPWIVQSEMSKVKTRKRLNKILHQQYDILDNLDPSDWKGRDRMLVRIRETALEIDKNECAISPKDSILFGSMGKNLDPKIKDRIASMMEDNKEAKIKAANIIKETLGDTGSKNSGN